MILPVHDGIRAHVRRLLSTWYALDDAARTDQFERAPFGLCARRRLRGGLAALEHVHARAGAHFHPAFHLRQPLQKRLGWRDFALLRRALDGRA